MELIREARPRAAKQYRCDNCLGAITPGTKYYKQMCGDGGGVFVFRSHEDCLELSTRLNLEGGVDGEEVALLHEMAEYIPQYAKEFPDVAARFSYGDEEYPEVTSNSNNEED